MRKIRRKKEDASITYSQHCRWDGCGYTSTASSPDINKHNMSSHESNLHSQTTKIWYGATQSTIHRDNKSKLMTCLCDQYSHKDASLVRIHAKKAHRGMGIAATTPGGKAHTSSLAALSSKSITAKQLAQDPAAGPPKSRRVDESLSASASKSATSAMSRSTKTTTTPPSAHSPPLDFRMIRYDNMRCSGESPVENTSKKRPLDELVAGPSTKIRRLDVEPKTKTTIDSTQSDPRGLYVNLKGGASSVTPVTATSRAPSTVLSMQPTSLVARSAFKKLRISSKALGKSISGPSSPRRLVSGLPGLSAPQRRSSQAPPREVLKSEPGLKTSLPKAQPAPVSSATSNVQKSTGPSPRDAVGFSMPEPRQNVALKALRSDSSDDAPYRCSSCGDTIVTDKWDICTMCRLDALSPKNVAQKDPRPVLVPAINATNAQASSTTDDPAPQPKPRPRMTKKMRQREFKSWFSNWVRGYREHPELRAVTAHNTDYWRDEKTRREGGTVYPTMDAMFSALQRAWHYQQVEKIRGGTQVVEFYGAYSIVAQPRINAHNRHEMIRERMRQIGIQLDTNDYGKVYFKHHKSGDDEVAVTDDVFKYPCPCGGSSVPSRSASHPKHRVPDASLAGPCGGTVMIIVGRDDALNRPHRISGQRIAVDIVH